MAAAEGVNKNVPDVSAGDDVLVHLGFAVERLDPRRAEEAHALRQELG